jgi:hypothetical protein
LFDVITLGISLTVALLVAHETLAESRTQPPRNQRWQAECGSCHIAYPPAFLSASSWRRLMSGLDKHFGTDASLDPGTAAEIGAFLELNAGTGRRAQETPAGLRITESRWFVREHNEVPAAAWKHPAVRSAANCASCHTLAEQGDFRERNIRIPR